jgi:LDH2 family malate/lactate/ureidoglycolate dehydrogenase
MNLTRVPQQLLRTFAEETFQRVGIPAEDAVRAADVLIETDLRGIDSHGMARIDQFYLQTVEIELVKARPERRVIRETPTSAVIDADGGLGLVVGTYAMDMAVQKAVESGSGFVAVPNSRHYGAAGIYSIRALDHDCIGLSMTNSATAVVPPGGLDPMAGTNPISVAAPSANGTPFLFDMATSTVSGGKLEIYSRQGKDPPPGWAQDESGAPIVSDPKRALALRRLTPLGSDLIRSSYKGFGLAVVVDIFCGLLSGMGPGTFLQGAGAGFDASHFFGCWRIDAFCDPDEFKNMMANWLDEIRATPVAPGDDPVRVPGDRQAANKADRLINGIPLYPDVIESLRRASRRLGVPLDV